MKYFLILLICFSFSCSSVEDESHKLVDETFVKKDMELINRIKFKNDTTLEKDIVSVTLKYVGWGCPCPQWITPKNKIKYDNFQIPDSIPMHLFWYILPENDSILRPSSLTDDMTNSTFVFEGQFYVEPQFLGIEGEQGPAKTFLYHSVKLKSNKTVN